MRNESGGMRVRRVPIHFTTFTFLRSLLFNAWPLVQMR